MIATEKFTMVKVKTLVMIAMTTILSGLSALQLQ
jgi:hypothetical protein